MRHLSRLILQPTIIMGVSLLASACTEKPLPILLEKYCVSESGLSKYWLTLNTSERGGTIRYQYMEQDVRYVVKAMQIKGRKVSGRAEFHTSSTDETRGNPIVFNYDNGTDTPKDGDASAACQNSPGNEQS